MFDFLTTMSRTLKTLKAESIFKSCEISMLENENSNLKEKHKKLSEDRKCLRIVTKSLYSLTV
jgi:hypothetical protein